MAKGTGAVELSEALFTAIESGDQEKAYGALKFSLTLDGALTTTEKGQKTTVKQGFKVIMLDGLLSTQIITNGKAGAWQSTEVTSLIRKAALIRSGTINGLSDTYQRMVNTLRDDPEFQAALEKLPTTPNFLTLSRTVAAPLIDEQKMIEFAYVYDFAILFQTREMNTLVKKILELVADKTQTQSITTTLVHQAVGLLSTALHGTTLRIKPWVGAQDGLFHALIVEGALNFNGSVMYITDDLISTMTLKVTFDKIGEPVEIAAPE